jgi:RNA polymerase sigma-54 factor
MAITQRLELRQGQSLVMTPQLQQAIKLLQLSQIELASYIEQELERNPLLSRDEGPGDAAPVEGEWNEGGDNADPAAGRVEAGPVGLDRDIQDQSGLGERAASLEEAYDNVFGDDATIDKAAHESAGPDDLTATNWSALGPGGRSDFDDGETSGDARLASVTSLRDHLMGQMAELVLAPAERLIAVSMIDSLDESGYLTESVEDIAQRLGTEESELEALLQYLQSMLDPPGVFARSLQECLTIQCREADRLDPSMAAVLGRLDLVARRDLSALARIANVDEEEILEIIKEIRTLNPKPGLAFDTAPIQTVVPDVYIKQSQGGDWLIELNADTMPRVLIDRRYAARLGAGGVDKSDKAYLSDCLASANWLVKALDQRARTILKVATSLARQQDGFLRHGISHLRPMNLKAIAEEIAMHESTVSRVTANKWIWTPRGLFEMKFFFTAAIGSTDGSDAHSAESVRHRIRQLIDGEAPKAILSDDKLVDLLKREGIDIARRTVAKYREAMGIGSSTDRRRQKALGKR